MGRRLSGRGLLIALAAASLVAGIAGGLQRLGWSIELPGAAVSHGALMIGGFLGTVISLERAVAMARPWGYAAPALSGLGSLLLLLGFVFPGAVAFLLGPLVLFAASAVIWRRQPLLHNALLAAAALALEVANACTVFGAPRDAAAAWGFVFLVVTITAERMEMTRILKPRPLSRPLFHAATAPLVAGAALMAWEPAAGSVLFGAGLLALAAWLVTYDIARKTVRSEGLPRFAAVSLLAGYIWLAISGAAWIAMPWQGPWLRDAALHALGLGFVFSMIFAHAPIILPAVARVKVPFSGAFYVPLAALHASVLARVFLGAQDGIVKQWSGAANALAIALFVATILGSASSGARRKV